MLSRVSHNFARILGNFMKRFKDTKQFLKKFCINFEYVKCGHILIKTYSLFK